MEDLYGEHPDDIDVELGNQLDGMIRCACGESWYALRDTSRGTIVYTHGNEQYTGITHGASSYLLGSWQDRIREEHAQALGLEATPLGSKELWRPITP